MGSFRYGDIYPVAMNLLTTRRVDVRPLISKTFPLSRVGEALEIRRYCSLTARSGRRHDQEHSEVRQKGRRILPKGLPTDR